ncbi:MAG: rRNA (guanosine-2-O-)-methyltransferase RlmB [Planctomycetota bacterium]
MKKPARGPSSSPPPHTPRPGSRPPYQKRPAVAGEAGAAAGAPRPAPAGAPRPAGAGPKREGKGRPAAERDEAGDGAETRRHASKSEQKVHGLRACTALFAKRPGDIIRVYLSANRRPTFKTLLEYCVSHRLGFQFVDDENLHKLSGGIHHEGIVILAREAPRISADQWLAGIASKTISGPFLLLDGVQNPHNLGSILRSAAHFGCGGVIGEAAQLPPLSAAALRVAEGGAESVPLVAVEDPFATLGALKKLGVRVVSTTSRAETPIAAAGLSRDVVLILGSEAEGVSPRLARLADLQVRIPGCGAVQSLNVAVACGIVLAEACRGTGEPAKNLRK